MPAVPGLQEDLAKDRIALSLIVVILFGESVEYHHRPVIHAPVKQHHGMSEILLCRLCSRTGIPGLMRIHTDIRQRDEHRQAQGHKTRSCHFRPIFLQM